MKSTTKRTKRRKAKRGRWYDYYEYFDSYFINEKAYRTQNMCFIFVNVKRHLYVQSGSWKLPVQRHWIVVLGPKLIAMHAIGERIKYDLNKKVIKLKPIFLIKWLAVTLIVLTRIIRAGRNIVNTRSDCWCRCRRCCSSCSGWCGGWCGRRSSCRRCRCGGGRRFIGVIFAIRTIVTRLTKTRSIVWRGHNATTTLCYHQKWV